MKKKRTGKTLRRNPFAKMRGIFTRTSSVPSKKLYKRREKYVKRDAE